MTFNRTTAAFSASFKVDTSITEPTVIYWSQEYYYPQGFELVFTDSQGKRLNFDSDYKLDQSIVNYTKILVINPALNG
jgi:hypothetical protein